MELTRELARLQARIPHAGTIKVATRSRRALLSGADSTLLTGDSPAIAAAALASLVSTAASGANVRLQSVRVRSDSNITAAGHALVSVSADVMGDIRGLTQLLLSLEGTGTRLRIRELSIVQPEPGASSAQPETLHLEMLLEGLARVSKTRS